MLYIQTFYQRNFKAKTGKDAYMKACGFIAKHILNKDSKVEVSKITWAVAKVEDEDDSPTFRLTIYYTFDDAELNHDSCEACKQFHKAFFINENFNCNKCNKVGYGKNVKQKLDIGSGYFKKLLDNELDKFN